MKKIILGVILSASILNAGLFGDTEEEQKIAQKRMHKLMFQGLNKEVLKLKKDNAKLKKILKKRKINYEYALKANGIEKINNTWTITEEKEIKLLKAENKELKRLVDKNTINYKTNNNSKERENAKADLKKQMSF